MLAAATVAGCLAAPLTGVLWRRGMRSLSTDHQAVFSLLMAAAFGGVATGFIISAAKGGLLRMAGLAVWACVLTAAAACDLRTQRIPTGLVRQGGLVTSALLILGYPTDSSAVRLLLVTVAAACLGGLVAVLGWRLLGLGFGDVRLCVLGGLGLGQVNAGALRLAAAAFVAAAALQLIVAATQGKARSRTVPLGPPLAVFYLVAACS